MLTQDQIDTYHEDGFILVEDVITPEQLARLREITDELIEKSRDVTESNDVYDLDDGHSSAEPKLTRIKLPTKQHPYFWEVARTSRMCRRRAPAHRPERAIDRPPSSTPRRRGAGRRSNGTRTGPSTRTPTTICSPAA